MNLLVPTINPSQTFGGISTALNLFRELENRYTSAADFRIIITEAPTRPEALIHFQNYKYSNLSVHDEGHPREIVDALEKKLRAVAYLGVSNYHCLASEGFRCCQRLMPSTASSKRFLVTDGRP